MRAACLAALLVALALLLGACGGDDGGEERGGSADDYIATLDESCAEQKAFFDGLPQQQVDEKLSFEEVDKLATESSEGFIADVAALEPPEDLADGHQAIVDLLQTDPTTESTTPSAYYGDLADAYAEVGAEGCEKIARDSQVALEQNG